MGDNAGQRLLSEVTSILTDLGPEEREELLQCLIIASCDSRCSPSTALEAFVREHRFHAVTQQLQYQQDMRGQIDG